MCYDVHVEVVMTIRLDNSAMIENSAKYVREKYNIPLYTRITKEFEKEFKCKILHDDYNGQIIFEDEKDELMFILRWS